MLVKGYASVEKELEGFTNLLGKKTPSKKKKKKKKSESDQHGQGSTFARMNFIGTELCDEIAGYTINNINF